MFAGGVHADIRLVIGYFLPDVMCNSFMLVVEGMCLVALAFAANGTRIVVCQQPLAVGILAHAVGCLKLCRKLVLLALEWFG